MTSIEQIDVKLLNQRLHGDPLGFLMTLELRTFPHPSPSISHWNPGIPKLSATGRCFLITNRNIFIVGMINNPSNIKARCQQFRRSV